MNFGRKLAVAGLVFASGGFGLAEERHSDFWPVNSASIVCQSGLLSWDTGLFSVHHQGSFAEPGVCEFIRSLMIERHSPGVEVSYTLKTRVWCRQHPMIGCTGPLRRYLHYQTDWRGIGFEAKIPAD